MATIDQRNKILREGAAAEQLLKNETLSSAFDELLQTAAETLFDMPAYKEADIQALFMYVKGLKQARAKLYHKLEQATLERQNIAYEVEEKKREQDERRNGAAGW